MKCYAKKVIEIATAEVGYLEKKTNSQLTNKTANAGYNNFTKYADYFDKEYPNFYNGKKNGYAWCDMFVDWVFVQAFGKEKGRTIIFQPLKSCGAGCMESRRYYKNNGRLFDKPKAGDQIFFYNSSKTEIAHTGLVYKVDKSKVYTIEGNTSSKSGVVANGGAVEKKSYDLTYSRIAGYGRPAYDEEPKTTAKKETKPATKPAKKSVEAIAKEVIDGKWGNGKEREKALEKAGYDYSAVQKKVNELTKTPAKKEYQCIHTVERGESLWLLATKYLGNGTRYTEIMKLNNKKNANLKVGEKLKIPNK